MESTIDLVHAAQWAALRGWAELVPPAARQRESTIPGWTVDELLSHLARSVDAIAALRPAARARPTTDVVDDVETTQTIGPDRVTESVRPDDGGASAVLTVSQYLAGYADRDDDINTRTKRSAAASAADRTGELDAAFTQSQRTLGALGDGDQLVTAAGGPILLSDFLQTRLIELVVHGRDLERSLPDYPAPPVLPVAIGLVDQTLRAVLAERTSDPLPAAVTTVTPEAFIDIASGRSAVPDGLPASLQSALPLF